MSATKPTFGLWNIASRTSCFPAQHASQSASARWSAGSSKFALGGYGCTTVKYVESSSTGGTTGRLGIFKFYFRLSAESGSVEGESRGGGNRKRVAVAPDVNEFMNTTGAAAAAVAAGARRIASLRRIKGTLCHNALAVRKLEASPFCSPTFLIGPNRLSV